MPFRRTRHVAALGVLLCLSSCDGCTGDDDDDPPPPTAPTGLTATLVTSGRIALAWIDTSLNEREFRIERSADGITWTVVGRVGANVTTFVDCGLIPATSYFYRVSAAGNGGSASSPIINPTTTNVTWRDGVGSGPTARIGHSAIYDPVGKRMLVFGGDDGIASGNTSLKNDVWALDLSVATPVWSGNALAVTGGPPARRWSHSAVFDPSRPLRPRMLVFGGDAGDPVAGNLGNQSDVWELTLPAGGTPTWAPLSPASPAGAPAARSNHTAVFDTAHARMIVFGGANGTTLYDDAWALDVSASLDGTWIPLARAPAVRWLHSAIFDADAGRMVVFGGQDTAGRANDVLTLSLPATPSSSAWSTLVSSAASPVTGRALHSAIYDARNCRMVVFGGDAGALNPAVAETWILPLKGAPRFVQATPSSPPVPPGRLAHSAVYDPGFERMIIFSGDGGSLGPVDDLAWPLDF